MEQVISENMTFEIYSKAKLNLIQKRLSKSLTFIIIIIMIIIIIIIIISLSLVRLKDRYGNPQLILSVHMSALVKLAKV